MSQEKDASVKRAAEPNLFAAPLSSTEDQPKPKITGRPQTTILIWSLLIVPLTLSAFFGTLFGGFWLAENQIIAISSTFTMLCAMGLAIAVFCTCVAVDFASLAFRTAKRRNVQPPVRRQGRVSCCFCQFI